MTAPGPMSPPAGVGAPLLAARPRGRMWVPMLAAFAVEAIILAAIVLWLTHHPLMPAISPQFGPIRLDFTKPPTHEAASTAPPVSAAPRAPAARTAEPAKPTPPAAQDQAPPAPPSSQPAPPQTSPSPSPTPSLAPSQPQAAPSPSPAASSGFILSRPPESAIAGPPLPSMFNGNGQIDDSEFLRKANVALHEAARKMNTLRGIRLVGRVELLVHYRDGKAWDPRILKSSGLPMLDQAVANAATQANWPPPPPGLEGRELVLPLDGLFQ